MAQAGDNIISSTDLYGGTVSLFTHTLSKLGIEVRYADPSDPKNFEKAVDDYLTEPTPVDSTPLGEVPQEPTKGSIRPGWIRGPYGMSIMYRG